MKIFTCRICGEVYLGENIPHTCPFCGVKNKFLVLSKAWKSEYDLNLSEIDKTNLQTALDLELSNSAFYLSASKNISNQEFALMFKGLFKVEREHASIFRKVLKPTEEKEIKEDCPDDYLFAVKESQSRESRAITFYSQALRETEIPRLKEIFTAIMEVETDHLSLDKKILEN